jgi:hypothetical protein
MNTKSFEGIINNFVLEILVEYKSSEYLDIFRLHLTKVSLFLLTHYVATYLAQSQHAKQLLSTSL